MTVRRLDGGTVKDEQDQQHTKAAFQRGGAVLNRSGQHGDKLPGIVHNSLVKISRKGAKAQRKPQKPNKPLFSSSFAPLRLCGKNLLRDPLSTRDSG